MNGWAETFKSPVFCKENDLKQTSMKKFQPLIFRGVKNRSLPKALWGDVIKTLEVKETTIEEYNSLELLMK